MKWRDYMAAARRAWFDLEMGFGTVYYAKNPETHDPIDLTALGDRQPPKGTECCFMGAVWVGLDPKDRPHKIGLLERPDDCNVWVGDIHAANDYCSSKEEALATIEALFRRTELE